MKSSRQHPKKDKKDGKFHSKNINHNPQAESARAKFGLNNTSDGDRKGDW